MTPEGMGFVALVIGALTLFGCVLGFASWEETRARRRKEKYPARVTETPAARDAMHRPHPTARAA